MPNRYSYRPSCTAIVLCNIKHAVPANAGELIDYYSHYSEHL